MRMTSMLIPSSNSTQKTTTSDQRTSRSFQQVRCELVRLATFQSWTDNIHPMLSKGQLAKAGFCYMETEHTLICSACDFKIELCRSDIDPIEEHMKQNPQCKFALSSNDLLPKTNLQLVSMTSGISRMESDDQNNIDADTNDQQDNSSPQKSFFKTLSNVAIDKIRANTFTNWPLITPNAQAMIVAGWSYTNIADRVICIDCNALFHNWTEADRPYEIHRLKSPHCPFILATEKKAANGPTSTITITTEPNTQAMVEVANTAYTLACRRHETFQNWPHTDENPLPSIESFVDAGFFYTGKDTIVKCFYCNQALKNWRAMDDPKIEHARWYPQCAYIRQYIGEDLYQAIQRKNQELKAIAQQNGQEIVHVQTSQTAAWSPDEIDRMVKARLDLPIVEKLRQLGFSMAIIRKTFEMQLKFKKDDFKTDNDLRLACFILDQQVKLINGNETNLLSPQNWMKTYTGNQQGNIQQLESPQKRTVQIPPKNIVASTIPAPVVSRPRILPKTDEEAMPCVLCLTTERQVACLPCGHLSSCVACGHSLKTCPICRAPVKAFVRIYM